MDYFYYAFVILAFLAVASFVEGVFLFWNASLGPESRRLGQRLRLLSAGVEREQTPLLKQRLLSEVPTVQRLLLVLPRIHVLDRVLIQSGSDLNVLGFLGRSAALALGAGAGASFLGARLWLVALAATAAGLAPLAYLLHLRAKRLRAIEEQLPDALELMARAMQAGHAFSSALRLVATEGQEPIAQEFRTTFDEINFGVSMQDALTDLAMRVKSTDLRYFVIAVLVHRETGGNLTQLLMSISTLIRERLKLSGTVRVLAAEGRLSAWILGLLPFVVGGIINFLNPGFMSVLWSDPAGIRLVVAALGLMAIGVIWLSRLIVIRI